MTADCAGAHHGQSVCVSVCGGGADGSVVASCRPTRPVQSE